MQDRRASLLRPPDDKCVSWAWKSAASPDNLYRSWSNHPLEDDDLLGHRAKETRNVQQQRRLQFDNLPLTEVALRLSFEVAQAVDFKVAKQLLEELDGFNDIDLPPDFDVPPGIAATWEVGPTTPCAFRLSGHKQGINLTIQRQMIAARWEAKSGAKYPKYPALRVAISDLLIAVRKLGLDAPVAVVNMVYINFIPTAVVGDAFLRKYFSDRAQCGLFKGSTKIQQYTAAWRASSTIDLRVDLRHATRNKSEGQRLLTAGGSRIQPEDDPLHHLDEVHGALRDCFNKLVSDEAKVDWEFKGEVPCQI